jgi:hypothetical protein
MVITRSDKDTEYQKIISMKEKYPDRAICYIQREEKCCLLPKLDKSRFLIPLEMPLIQVISIIRKRLKIDGQATQAMFLFIGENRKMYPAGTLMGTLYDNERSEDQMLYIYYNAENTFG